MIIVAEGISAAGKTTFASQFGEGRWLPEIPVKAQRPPDDAPAREHAKFWADNNAARFQMAIQIEREHGFVICDTDPLKIHYAWCMERAGFDWPDRFELAAQEVRRAISEERLGFADLYLVKRIDEAAVRSQKEGDVTRRRSNFDQHLALQPHLIDWFAAMSRSLPGHVRFGFPNMADLLKETEQRGAKRSRYRFDVGAFDRLIEALPA
ncbi:hypothetical protein [Erythrobacter sp. F6033]|uniref:hypothetical protein n=1 Tax=Erythrobacter sp. F6033 TaxID=2926401 RepID=UPI001FF4F044|nr:hypothetical protein [Erythrobacter sp. F6033]MCK0129149.1 hypothetical protein [Erythrobacter sp. F6033]